MTGQPCLVCDRPLLPSPIPGLLRCPDCSFVSADVAVSEEELRELYDRSYFCGDEYADYVADRHVHEKQFRRRLRTLLRHVPEDKRRSLLEIGCAYGFFLQVARGAFAELEGFDISEAATEYAREVLQLPVTTGDLLSHTVSSPPDVACLWDTIEHLPRPDLVIRRLGEIMPPRSILAITTGDIGSLVARARGRRWRQIHPPTHLHYFSRRSIQALLERHGFQVIEARYEGMYRSLDTMAHIVLKRRNGLGWLYEALRATGILRFDLYLDLRDILLVIAERRSDAGSGMAQTQ